MNHPTPPILASNAAPPLSEGRQLPTDSRIDAVSQEPQTSPLTDGRARCVYLQGQSVSVPFLNLMYYFSLNQLCS